MNQLSLYFYNICKYVPVIIVYLIIFVNLYCYLEYYLLDEIKGYTILTYVYLFAISFITFMIILNHLLCLCVNPGQVEQNKLRVNSSEYCEKCYKSRPIRAHHCKSCEKCVIKMDHHCIFIANCVGYRNQKYFFLFLFYSTLGCLICFFGMLQKFLNLKDYLDKYHKEKNPIDSEYDSDILMYSSLVLFSTVSSVLLFIGIGILLVLHSYLIFNNLTTIENMKYKKKENSPFYSNNICSNFKLVMGNSIFIWFLPVFYKDDHEGYDFETVKKISSA